ncbi:hypothetical protein BDW69DRAFT_119948 [Aspergillus filifer]
MSDRVKEDEVGASLNPTTIAKIAAFFFFSYGLCVEIRGSLDYCCGKYRMGGKKEIKKKSKQIFILAVH